MKVYSDAQNLMHVRINRNFLEVHNSYELKDELKTRGYRFDAGTKTWGKQIPTGKDAQIAFLREELTFLEGKSAIEAYSKLDYCLMSMPDLPARERELRKGEWEDDRPATPANEFALKRLLGDPGLDATTHRGIYDKLHGMGKSRQSFEIAAKSAAKRLLFDGGLISEEELMREEV